MKPNLNKIAQELYGKIQTRFSNIKIGDENAGVLSRKEDIPEARFFEFEYVEKGITLGTIAITLDEDDGVVVQVSGNLANRKHPGAFKFIRSFRQFAKDRLLNFDVQNIGKNNLDKRDYTFQAKAKELPPMEPIMESKLYGTSRMSYQDLGEATLIIKHSQPVNTALPAGRTMHIESIYVENAAGERFKYPFKHLGGARALAEHLKHGGIPYDAIGKHITSLSEELAQLRKFKGYVGRNETLGEAMGDITSKVMERIEQIKKEVTGLSRKAYYEQFAESFAEQEEQMIPEDIMSDWIDRLTIRTFNEELKTAFPYIFKLVSETDIPVRELDVDDILGEVFSDEEVSSDTTESFNLEDQFENFVNSIVREDEEEFGQGIFDPNETTRDAAVEKLNDIFKTELKGGVAGINIIDTLKDLVPNTAFLSKMKELDPDLDARSAIEIELTDMANGNENLARAVTQLDFHGGDEEIGGEDTEVPPAPTPTEAPPAPTPAEAPAPEAPPAPAPAAPAGEVPPPAPVAEARDTVEKDEEGNIKSWKHEGDWKKSDPKKNLRGKVTNTTGQALKKSIELAKNAGATLETQLDFGHGVKSLAEIIDECGLTPMECGFEQPGNPTEAILDSISGFWSPQEKNFTTGGTKAKIKVLKSFKDGEYPGANPTHVKQVIDMIEKLDPSTPLHSELGHIKKLAGVNHQTMDEDPQDDFNKLMQDFMAQNQGVDINGMVDKFKQEHPDATVTQNHTSSGTINGKPASYDDAMKQMPKVNFGGQDFDFNKPDEIGKKIQGMVGNQMGKVQGQVPNQNVQFPGGQMNPQDMMKQIMSKLNFGK